MKNLSSKIILTSMIALSSSAAFAGNNASVADFNGDGMVTSEELVTYVQMNFLKMDKNNDQMLDKEEAALLDEIFDIDG